MYNFIVFTGLDGSGKGEQIAKLSQYLYEKNKHKDIYLTREPSNSPYGKKIREEILKETNPLKKARLCLELYTKDREWHVNNIILPQLQKGNILICDRYYYDTMAFQQTQGISLNEIIELNKRFPKPDITFILDVNAETALKRIEKRGLSKTKFEELEFMKELKENFLDLPNHLNDNIKIINAVKSIEEVFADIHKYFEEEND